MHTKENAVSWLNETTWAMDLYGHRYGLEMTLIYICNDCLRSSWKGLMTTECRWSSIWQGWPAGAVFSQLLTLGRLSDPISCLFLIRRNQLWVNNTTEHRGIYCIVGKFGKSSMICKSSEIILTSNMVNLLIHQTVFTKCLKRVNSWNFPAIWYFPFTLIYFPISPYQLFQMLSYTYCMSWVHVEFNYTFLWWVAELQN